MIFCVDIGIYHEEWGMGSALKTAAFVEMGAGLSGISQDNTRSGCYRKMTD